jgi:hypothetical protein
VAADHAQGSQGLNTRAREPVGATSIDWPMPVRDRRRQERTGLERSMGAKWEQWGSGIEPYASTPSAMPM